MPMNNSFLESTVKEAFSEVSSVVDASLNVEVNSNNVYVELVKDDRQLAECYFYLNDMFKEIMVEYLQVDCDYRMKGIGSFMAEAMEDVGLQNGIESLELVPKNEDARFFWLKQGYTAHESLNLMVKYL